MSEKLEEQMKDLQDQISKIKPGQENKLSMVVFSGDLDKALGALIIATGAAAMGMKVSIFMTFWGISMLRDKSKKVGGKNLLSKMFGFMLPKGAEKLSLSKMNMGGMGTNMMKSLMKKKNVSSVPQMLELCEQLGIEIKICEMSMDLMGFKREEMIDYPNLGYAGVATFINDAQKSKVQLFI